ncbi:MAG: glycosyltransferase family 4 protein [Chloroflexi bacterium]|nr:glycosyltransferase family 4 protein [Chloroflexota bacterium]
MRILMLTQFYLPLIGGEENHVRNLSAALVSRGHEVAIVTLWHKGLAEFEVEEGVRIYRIRGTLARAEFLFAQTERRSTPPLPDPETVWALRRIIKEERPALVHAHNWLIYSFLPLKKWSGAKLVLSLHDFSFACPIKRFLYQEAICSGPNLKKCSGCTHAHYGLLKALPTLSGHRLMGLFERKAVELFLPVSQAIAEGNGLTHSSLPYQVVPNFIPDEVAKIADQPDPLVAQLPSQKYLLYVGALARYKGVDVLLRAYANLKAPPPLVLIGYPAPDMPTEFPPNVKVFQNWPHRAVMQAWQASLIGLTPSICAEACPTVVMEAMATGRPVIGTNVGGIPDLIEEGQTGFLVTPRKADELGAAIERLLSNPALCERMGLAAQVKIKDFQATTVVSKIEALYQKLF